MGHGIARNLVTKGFPLAVRVNRNRKPLEDLLAAGAKEMKTNAEVAQNADVVATHHAGTDDGDSHDAATRSSFTWRTTVSRSDGVNEG